MIFDHYLAISNWSPYFVYSAARVKCTQLWILFPSLNIAFYDENFLLAMVAAVGTPMRVDRNTLKVERGRFPRVCVEMNLNGPVVSKV